MPDTALENRISSQWGDIGFQGKNPATDFRGMGMSVFSLVFSVLVVLVSLPITWNRQCEHMVVCSPKNYAFLSCVYFRNSWFGESFVSACFIIYILNIYFQNLAITIQNF
jgi:hypothetical protein